MIFGPPQMSVLLMDDPEPFDWGDIHPTDADYQYVNDHGVYGVIATATLPACPCCGHKAIVEAALWGVCGDDDYVGFVKTEQASEAAFQALAEQGKMHTTNNAKEN